MMKKKLFRNYVIRSEIALLVNISVYKLQQNCRVKFSYFKKEENLHKSDFTTRFIATEDDSESLICDL